MSNIKNKVTATSAEAEVNCVQIEHRATWQALIFDEMRKAGVKDAEAIVRKAAGNKTSDPKAFEKVFVNQLGIDTFTWDSIKSDDSNFYVHFHYCPLLAAWQKLGFNDEDCSLLCDMAMDGDRGIAAEMGLKLDLDDTIARGGDCCKMHFYK
jgi:hypothetical protein